MNSVSSRLLLVWFLSFVAGTLAPFRFVTGTDLEHGLKLFEYGAFERDPIHFVFNMLLFVPLGVLLHHEGRRRAVNLLPIVLLAGIAGLSISMTVEYLQAYIPTRDSSAIDVLANTVGSLIGVVADRRWGAAAEARLAQVRAKISTAMLTGLIATVLLAALLVSAALQAGTRLNNWNPEYPLQIGNESTGDRPWRGRVFAVDITDAATPAASMRRFSAGESVGLPGAAVATFDFNDGPHYKDASGNLPGLEWIQRPSAPAQIGVRVGGGFWLQSTGPASGLAKRLQKSSAFTLRIQCATDDTNQEGPARIISNSASPYLRNFTVGQQGSDLVFRMRTPDTGLNGYPLEIYVPGIFAAPHRRDILATYDGATLLVAMAHGDEVSTTTLTPGSSVALAIPALHVRPHELPIYEIAYVAGLSLVPGALIGLLGHTSRERLAFSAAWVLAFAVLLEATITRVSGGSFGWTGIAQTAGAGTVVLAIFNAIFAGADIPWRPSARERIDIAPPDALDYQPRLRHQRGAS